MLPQRSAQSTPTAGLVFGRRCFTSYNTVEDRIRNLAWQNSVFSQPPRCSLTLTGQYRDQWSVRSGVATGSDIFIEHLSHLYRVAVGCRIFTRNCWAAFRCFVYPDVPGSVLERRVGILFVPRELGWSHHDSFWESDSSDTVANSLVSEWAAIPQEMRREATLTLPLGYDARFVDIVSFSSPPSFAGSQDYRDSVQQ